MATGWKRTLWLLAAILDFGFETAIRIRVLKSLGYAVVCDRYIEDSEMDLIMNFGENAASLSAWRIVKAIAAKPDIGIFLDLSLEESLRRSESKSEPFPDSEEKRTLRGKLYETLKEKAGISKIDAAMSIDEVSSAIHLLVFGQDSPIPFSGEASS